MLPSVAMFQGFHASGALVAPDVVAAKIVDKLILGDVERGRTYAYKDLYRGRGRYRWNLHNVCGISAGAAGPSGVGIAR